MNAIPDHSWEWGTPEEVIEENFLKFKNNQGE